MKTQTQTSPTLYVRHNTVTEKPFQIDAEGAGYLEHLFGTIQDLEAQRAALVDALRELLEAQYSDPQKRLIAPIAKARAALAMVEKGLV